jgi:hypothetical protein
VIAWLCSTASFKLLDAWCTSDMAPSSKNNTLLLASAVAPTYSVLLNAAAAAAAVAHLNHDAEL